MGNGDHRLLARRLRAGRSIGTPPTWRAWERSAATCLAVSGGGLRSASPTRCIALAFPTSDCTVDRLAYQGGGDIHVGLERRRGGRKRSDTACRVRNSVARSPRKREGIPVVRANPGREFLSERLIRSERRDSYRRGDKKSDARGRGQPQLPPGGRSSKRHRGNRHRHPQLAHATPRAARAPSRRGADSPIRSAG
jgi:hypothetical protein